MQIRRRIVDHQRHHRAAGRVHVAQPTLSAQFGELERKLGVRLVERDRSGVRVTPMGREVVDRARKVLGDVQAIIDLTAAEQQGFAGKLKLGVPPTLGPYLLPYVIPEMHARHPNLKLYVQEGTPREIQNAVVAGDLDLALTPLPVQPRTLEVVSLFKEELRVVCAPDHPLATKAHVALKDLRDQNVLALQAGHHLHTQVRGLCDEYGAELLYDYEGTSLDTLRHMVGMGVGISFFPELYILSEIDTDKELIVLPLHDAELIREICLVWRSGFSLAAQVEEMESLFKNAFDARHATALSA